MESPTYPDPEPATSSKPPTATTPSPHPLNPTTPPAPAAACPAHRHPTASDTYLAFFARSRLRMDALCWLASLALFLWLTTVRTLEALCTPPPPSPTTSPTLPTTPLTTTLLHLLRPPYPPPPPPTLTTFPCTEGLPQQLLWLAHHLPALLLHRFLLRGSFGLPAAWAFATLGLLGSTLLQRWYVRRGGRTLVIASCMLVPVATSIAEMLLLGGHSGAPASHAYLRAIWGSSGKSAASMLFQHLVFPLPAAVQLPVACANVLLATVSEALLQGPAPTAATLLACTLWALTFGVALPAALLLHYERSIKSQYRSTVQAAQYHGTSQAGQSLERPAAAAAKKLPQGWCGAGEADATEGQAAGGGGGDAPLAGIGGAGGGAEQQQPLPLPLPLPEQGHEQGLGAGMQHAPQQQQQQQQRYQQQELELCVRDAMPPRQRIPTYTPKLTFRTVSVKIDHHAAFDMRNEIRDHVESHLRARLAAPRAAAPPAAAPPATTPLTPLAPTPMLPVPGDAEVSGGGTGRVGGAGVRRRAVGLSTVMMQGCLQLVVSIYTSEGWEEGTCGSEGAAGGGGGAGAGGGGGGGGYFEVGCGGVGGVRGGAEVPLGTEGEVEAAVREALASCCSELGCRVTVSSLLDGAMVASSQELLGGAAGVGLQVEPACVEGGVGGWQEVAVAAGGVPGWVVGQEGAGAEAVVSCWKGGERLVLRQPLIAGGRLEGDGGKGGGSCRLQLPPQLDAAPVNVHLVATCPGHEGVLLATYTTMALPPPAARQLLPFMAQLSAADPDSHTSFLHLLADMAAAWQMLHPTATEPPPHQPVRRGGGGSAQAPERPQAALDIGGGAAGGDAARQRGGEAAAAGVAVGGRTPQRCEGAAVAAGLDGLPTQHREEAAVARACLGHIAEYCAAEDLPAVAGYLSTLLPPPLAPAGDCTSRFGCGAPGVVGSSSADGTCAVVDGSVAHAAPLPPPCLAAGAQPEAGTSKDSGKATAGGRPGASLASGAVESEAVGAGAGAAGGAPPSALLAPGTLQPGTAAWEGAFRVWQLRQGRRADLLASLGAPLAWALFLWRDSRQPGGWPRGLQPLRYPLVDILVTGGPQLVLALGSERLRQWRPWVIALQSALIAVKFLAAAACLVPQPSFAVGDAAPGLWAWLTLFLPALQRVGWKQQLLSSFLGEEVPLYLMLTSDCAPHSGRLLAPSLLQVLVVPLVAAAVSWMVELRCRVTFQRMHPLRGAAASQQGTKHKAE